MHDAAQMHDDDHEDRSSTYYSSNILQYWLPWTDAIRYKSVNACSARNVGASVRTPPSVGQCQVSECPLPLVNALPANRWTEHP